MSSPIPLAARMRAGEQLVGIVLKMPAAAMIETAGIAGFDVVIIDTEHGPGDTALLEDHLRAAQSVGVEALVRVGSNSDIEILRALDAGASGIVVPHVEHERAAADAVKAAHYPPVGRRGLATTTRAGDYGLADLSDHVRRAAERTLVVVQVEHIDAVPHTERIAREPGVDAVFLGPTDLSMSVGHPGELDHPAVASAIDEVVEGVMSADGPLLCVFASDEQAAGEWQRRGARLVLFGGPALVARSFRDVVRAARSHQPNTNLETGR
jgi:2-keto-3-deoxy-L-rhamnonate aldolase RhmA